MKLKKIGEINSLENEEADKIISLLYKKGYFIHENEIFIEDKGDEK